MHMHVLMLHADSDQNWISYESYKLPCTIVHSLWPNLMKND